MSTVVPHKDEIAVPHHRINLRYLSMILLVVMLFISGYLSYSKIAAVSVACMENSTFNCDGVTYSIFSKFPQGSSIDVAYLGFTLDAIMLVLLLVEPRIPFLRTWGVVVVFALALWGFLFHDYLTLMSITRIQKLCIWRLSHHTLMTILLIVTSTRLYRWLFRGESEYEVYTSDAS